jgi:diguanylate cyclase (GGDEF)-like protein/PAS domain S-box-containing protein
VVEILSPIVLASFSVGAVVSAVTAFLLLRHGVRPPAIRSGDPVAAHRQRQLMGEVSQELQILLDPEGQLVRATASLRQLLGYEEEALAGRQILELVHPEDAERTGAAFLRSVGGASSEISLVRISSRSADWAEFDVQLEPWCDPGGACEGFILFRGIAAAMRAADRDALRKSEERYALAAAAASDGLWDWDLSSDAAYFSPRWKRMLGYDEAEIGNHAEEWVDRIHPLDSDAFRETLDRYLASPYGPLEVTYRIFSRGGDYRWMVCRALAVLDAAGKVSRLVGSQTDITDRKRAEQELEHAALHDGLTGLPNRVLFAQCLTQAIVRSGRGAAPQAAVLYLDMDRFKTVNDSLGHQVGDELLRSFSLRVKSCLRGGDVLARLGGDEFAVLLEGLPDVAEAKQIADRILQALQRPFDLGEHEVFVSSSIGIASTSSTRFKVEDMLRDADTALYEAKALGRAQSVIFDERMHARVTMQLELENDLRRALERGEFSVYYQPIIELATGRIWGFEALVRWRHPSRGLVGPQEFVPLAEESGLILQIDQWVLLNACCQLREWQELAGTTGLNVSVNLSGRHLSQPRLPHEIARVLETSGLDSRALRLEITETSVSQDPEQARRQLREFRALGVGVAMDDFGIGSSSLGGLRELPFDTLKIDRSFLLKEQSDPRNWDLLQAIISLARSLKMEVVAEGVELEAQAEKLRSIGANYGQGYLFSRPVDCVAASALLCRQPRLPVIVARAVEDHSPAGLFPGGPRPAELRSASPPVWRPSVPSRLQAQESKIPEVLSVA